jgi:hypothetical protein
MLQYSFDESAGSALISEGLITQDQLSKAVKLKQQLGGRTTLGDVLLEMNWVSAPRLADFAHRHRSNIGLSDILIQRRLVTEHDVMAAREIQRKVGLQSKRIGETLVEMGIIEERHVIEALAEKFSLTLLDPDITEIDPELIRKVSLKYLRRQVALPIRIERGQLLLLVSVPKFRVHRRDRAAIHLEGHALAPNRSSRRSSR